MEQSKEKAFFLYYAAWLVHTPIHSRSKELLKKYCEKLGVDFPEEPSSWTLAGQKNPYYCAMVEMFDHYVGQLLQYLEETPDPRWPGHMLIENTYVILTSDNGGMERVPHEIITDNFPLDRGKINAREGGVRVPLIISGPEIRGGQQSNVMINGIDFYPTILSWTGTPRPESQVLDGCDISPLLRENPKLADLVKEKNGEVRNSMVWHFPHGVAQQSTLRRGGWKLIYNYMPGRSPVELFKLYEKYPNPSRRVDIEEAVNLADQFPEQAESMRKELFQRLDAMNASYPYLNPHYNRSLDGKDQVCTIVENGKEGSKVWAQFEEHGNQVLSGQIAYTLNGGERSEEWYLAPAKIKGGRLHGTLPEGSTHYFFNLIDEKNFLISYPIPMDMLSAGKTRPKGMYSLNGLEN